LHQWLKLRYRWLCESVFAARKLDRTDLDLSWEEGRPFPEERGTASRVWEAEKA